MILYRQQTETYIHYNTIIMGAELLCTFDTLTVALTHK